MTSVGEFEATNDSRRRQHQSLSIHRRRRVDLYHTLLIKVSYTVTPQVSWFLLTFLCEKKIVINRRSTFKHRHYTIAHVVVVYPDVSKRFQ